MVLLRQALCVLSGTTHMIFTVISPLDRADVADLPGGLQVKGGREGGGQPVLSVQLHTTVNVGRLQEAATISCEHNILSE